MLSIRILVTGFEPFAKNVVNPTEVIIKNISEVETLLLPVSYDRVDKILEDKIKEYKPDIIISLGLAQGRKEISLELCAINYMKASISDNDNITYDGKLISYSSPKAYFTSVNIKKLNNILNSNNINSNISTNCGTYVCNKVYYYLLNNESKYNYKALFIHFPTFEVYDLDEDINIINTIINNIKIIE